MLAARLDASTLTPPREPRNLMALPVGKTCTDCLFFTRKCAAEFGVDPRATSCEFVPAQFLPRLPGKAAD